MSFFATPLGVRVGAGLAALATGGGFAAAWLPNTVFINELKDAVHYYEHGVPKKMDDEILQRAQRVLRDVKINENFKNQVHFFYVSRPEPFYAGTPESGYGAIVGIPVNFTYKEIADVPVNQLGCIDKKVKVSWKTPAGKLLVESFVFSEEAQKYAIAQQIYMANSSHVTLNSVTSAAAILHTYLFSKIFNARMPGLPFFGRCLGYGLTGVLCGMAWIYVKDMTTYSRENDSLRKAIELGPEYARGAIEYYEKVIVRNKALKVILGDHGGGEFTARGNLNTLIRTPHMPLSACLDKAKEIAKLVSEEEE